MNLLKNKRFKYGSLSVVLTVVFIVLVFAANTVFNAIASANMWYIDMTGEEVYSLSEETVALIDENLSDIENDIKIIFCQPKDTIESDYKSNMVYNCAKLFAERYDFIDIEFYDIVRHPESVTPYLTTEISEIKTYNVIITNGSQSQVYTTDGFFTVDSETNTIFAFDGEYTIATAIMRMHGELPIACFTSGHGETVEGSNIYKLFEEAGFSVRIIDLSKDDIPDGTMAVVINNPRYDFLGAEDSVNEISKVDKFLDGFGALMVFVDASERELPELSEFLSEWGIAFGNALIRDYSSSLSVDGTELVCEYASDGVGSQITTSLRSLETIPKTVVSYARPVEILFANENSRDVSAVLRTSSAGTAEAVSFDGDASADAKGETGVYDLMAVSVEKRYVENEPHYSYVLAAGTSSFTDDKYISGANYGNRDVLFSAMKTFGKKAVPLNIEFKQLDDDALDITTAEANRWSVVIVVLPCALVSIAGIVVYIRRKRL